MDLRKAITNRLLDCRNDKNDKILNANIEQDLINKAPTDTKEIYKEITQRIQYGLRSVLRIADKFIHDDNVTLKMPPLHSDVESMFFSVALVIKYLLKQLE
jgi:hypothetical protein